MIYIFIHVHVFVAPKREKLKVAMSELAEVQDEVTAKEKELAEVNEEVKELKLQLGG
jgi:hypothetical protein